MSPYSLHRFIKILKGLYVIYNLKNKWWILKQYAGSLFSIFITVYDTKLLNKNFMFIK